MEGGGRKNTFHLLKKYGKKERTERFSRKKAGKQSRERKKREKKGLLMERGMREKNDQFNFTGDTRGRKTRFGQFKRGGGGAKSIRPSQQV